VIVVVCVAVVLVVTSLQAGLSGLLGIRWRHRWLLPLSLVVQTVVVEVPALPGGLARVVHVLSYVLAGVFLVLNRHVRGLWLLGLGVVSNAVTITLNGGTLPANPHALAVAGIRDDDAFANSGVVAHPLLPWLGDVFAVPQGVPFANVFSVGDVLIVAGAVWLVRSATRRPRHRASAPAQRQPPVHHDVDVLPGVPTAAARTTAAAGGGTAAAPGGGTPAAPGEPVPSAV
jgi:hypothetical protein